MEELGPPITFQTSTEDKIGNLQSTLEWAATIGADAVELPSQYVDQPVGIPAARGGRAAEQSGQLRRRDPTPRAPAAALTGQLAVSA